jgi:LCP family protein required for cell wall assembly
VPPGGLPPPNLPPPSGRAATPQGARPQRAPRKRRWWLRIPGILLLVWLLFLIAVPLWGWNRIDTVDAEPDGERPGDQPGTTYLIVGSDSREGLDAEQREELSTGEVAGSRTDTIMLLHIGDGKPVLLSIPRDSPVDIPGRGNGKINSAFSGDGGGPELLVETVEQNTGIRVDDYIEIGFGGFVDIVDGLGGVEICPKSAIDDPKAGLDNLEKGCQEADGVTALGYARTRKFALADLNRVQNQREVITAIGRKAASPWTVLNPWRYLQVVRSGTGSLTIGENVGPISLGRFLWNLADVTGGSGLSCTVPSTITSTSLQWDADRADRLFELIATDRTDDIGKALCTRSGQ